MHDRHLLSQEEKRRPPPPCHRARPAQRDEEQEDGDRDGAVMCHTPGGGFWDTDALAHGRSLRRRSGGLTALDPGRRRALILSPFVRPRGRVGARVCSRKRACENAMGEEREGEKRRGKLRRMKERQQGEWERQRKEEVCKRAGQRTEGNHSTEKHLPVPPNAHS